ncbi:MAG: ribosome maturation factor RimP [Clostridiales bacterium]|jgi:ribosome maturation factor RimP|nr:ribosome maturation factor RimP [Clostridiales bacterium]
MSKKNVTELVKKELQPFFEKESYVLYNTEFVKEGKDWYLRVFIEKAPQDGEEWPTSVGTDDCEKVSRYLSSRLDVLDPIEQNYYLEVSSPGLDRPLLKDEDYRRYRGELVDIKLYKGLDGKKNFVAKLLNHTDEYMEVEDENGKVIQLPFDNIAKVKLTVVF